MVVDIDEIVTQAQKTKKSIASSQYKKFRKSKHQSNHPSSQRTDSDFLMGVVLPKEPTNAIPEEREETEPASHLTSINSEEQVELGSTLTIVNNKYSVFHLYKWAIIVYQQAMITAILSTTLFMVFIMPTLEDVDYVVLLNHTLPIGVILIDFLFNCTPFILRQYILNTLIMIWYPIYSVIANYQAGTLFSNTFEWTEARVGMFYPLMLIPVGWIMHWLVTYLYILKLKVTQKNEALKQRRDIYEELKLIQAERKRG